MGDISFLHTWKNCEPHHLEGSMSLKRVLIVDDAMDLGRLFQDAIKTAYPGLPVTFVPSAEEAILEASRYTFDLLISDIRLPGMTGFDLCRKIRLRQPGVKIIMVTGLRVDDRLKLEADAVGASMVLSKPVSIPRLLEMVQQVSGGVMDEPGRAVEPGVLPPSHFQPSKTPTAPLRAPTPVEPSAPAEQTLSSELANLRGSLGASAVILLDETGHSAAQAGDWPDAEWSTTLVPDLMSSVSTMERVSHHLQKGLPRAVQALHGSTSDLVITSMGRFTLVVFMKHSPGMLRLALAFEEVMQSQERFITILEEMGFKLQPEAPAESVIAQPQPAAVEAQLVVAAVEPPSFEELKDLEQLEALFGKVTPDQHPQDADAFWDSLTVEDEKPGPSSPDMLSFDQALKLGLMPEDPPKK